MSERPREQSHQNVSRANDGDEPSGGRSTHASTPAHSQPAFAPSPTVAAPSLSRQASGHGRSLELPPLPRAPGPLGGSFSPASRYAGVASILNPVESSESSYDGRRRKASQVQSPASPMPSLPPLAASNASAQVGGPFAASPLLSAGAPGDRPAPRRILTPKSPLLHRAVSLNHLNAPTGTINAQQSPFPVSPRSRTYTIEPGSGGVPPMPISTATTLPRYSSRAPSPAMQATRRASTGARRMPSFSDSGSPESDYGQPDPDSPHFSMLPASMPQRSGPYSPNDEAQPRGSTAPTSVSQDQQHTVGIPMSSSSGGGPYQMMALATTSGTVHVPVDIQAASRVADEKRRRNAGASARFRQRRKEKEKEASTTISRLEQQVKELGDRVSFYKQEQEILSAYLSQMPGGERHFPRPQSPSSRRVSTAHAGPSEGGSASHYHPGHEQDERSPDAGRNVRRRTSTMSLPQPAQPTPQPPLPTANTPYQHGYGQQAYGQPIASQAPTLHPAPGLLPSPHARGALPASAPGPPQLMQATPPTGPWNPFERRSTGGPPGPSSESR